ncbi:MAG: hypothetical protein BWY72_00371 [Bacteroidetes bacterium ADurb.Bin416]|nr:MAG: hypothetical protein BWY72_00371 [Bacteroidetes bacterium ADurb.Bin416]
MFIKGWEGGVAFRKTTGFGVKCGIDGFRTGTIGGSPVIILGALETSDLQPIFTSGQSSQRLVHVECLLIEFNGMVANGSCSGPSGGVVVIKPRIVEPGSQINRLAARSVQQLEGRYGLTKGGFCFGDIGRRFAGQKGLCLSDGR